MANVKNMFEYPVETVSAREAINVKYITRVKKIPVATNQWNVIVSSINPTTVFTFASEAEADTAFDLWVSRAANAA